MERCGLNLLLLNRQGFTLQSCLALQLGTVSACLYCVHIYMLIVVSGRRARAYIHAHFAQRVNLVYKGLIKLTEHPETCRKHMGRATSSSCSYRQTRAGIQVENTLMYIIEPKPKSLCGPSTGHNSAVKSADVIWYALGMD